MGIRILIVDDELMARKRLRRFILKEPDIEIVGECANGRDAIAAIKQLIPDLVFLDVQMPEMNAFEVLRAVGVETMPLVIFVTAYEEFALQAFEARAIDYLLKPFDYERFQKALERAKTYLKGHANGAINERLSALLDHWAEPSYQRSHLAVQTSGRLLFLKLEDIDWVEAAGNYVGLHVGRDNHLLHTTMNELEKKLPPRRFLRIHRSTMVNLNSIREIQPLFHGDSVVVLKNGTRLNASRSGSQKLLNRLEQLS
jgi:two-component system LytT family response regulator